MNIKSYFKYFFIILILFIINHLSFSQTYTYPTNPNQKTFLTGNIGEIRASHFHAGLDIGVNTNTKVHSAEDGYVSRLAISSYGYGKVLYITHPKTNQVTVYGHLNAFNKSIADFARTEQYKNKNFEIDLELKPNQLPVKKDEIIAFSGNTGSSAGPHLHYEIRTLQDIALNASKYPFSELPPDNKAPLIQKIAIRSLDISGRVNHQFGRFEFKPKEAKKGLYHIKQIIPVYGLIGFEVLTHDILQNSTFKYATNSIEIKINGKTIHKHVLDSIDHNYNRCMNVHVDYETYQKYLKGFQKCYRPDGNKLNIYQKQVNKGMFRVKDNKIYSIEIIAKDSKGNTSILKFRIKGQKNIKKNFKKYPTLMKARITHLVDENILKISGFYLKSKGSFAKLCFNGIIQKNPLAYQNKQEVVFLWDLRKGLPDFVEIDGIRHNFHFEAIIPSNQNFSFENERVKIYFPKEALFDTLYLETFPTVNGLAINNRFIPLFSPIEIEYKPLRMPREIAKTTMYFQGRYFLASQWKNKTVSFKTRLLGNYLFGEDLEKPEIEKMKNQVLHFKIKDDFSGIADFQAKLNGKFLLMDYEHKKRLIKVIPRFPKQKLKGNFELIVKDNAGNKAVFRNNL